MKPVASLVVLCAFWTPAIAQTSECQSIPKASDRLACYDKAMPPKNKAKPATASSPAASSPAAPSAPATKQGPLGDMLANENAQLDAKIKNICRGC